MSKKRNKKRDSIDGKIALARNLDATPEQMRLRETARGLAAVFQRHGISAGLDLVSRASGISIEELERQWVQDEGFYE